ncbi:MAG: Gfo/Idh/MocA family oxidoreductase [Balneolales bacterium]
MDKSNNKGYSRKSFLKKVGVASAAFTGFPYINSSGRGKSTFIDLEPKALKNYSKNDNIQIAVIGAGGMGQGDTRTALEIEGVKLVAACDLYDARLERCKELWGQDIFTTRDYREILTRSDVDAVIVATTDHWHDTIAIDALNSGKAVYLEKPMVQHIEEGQAVIDAEKSSGMPLIIGSQISSSLLQDKASELLAEGAIGKLNLVETYNDRFSALGAWQYSIPPSASENNIDWDTYLKDLPKIPFDPKRFFRWRNYKDYGTGVAGDLFVHMFTGVHQVTRSKGPRQIVAMGGLRHWHDERDVADIMIGMYDYPETETHPAFNLTMRVNFVDGSGGGSHTRYIGSEGEMVIRGGTITVKKATLPDAPGMSIDDFGEDIRLEYEEYYKEKYPESRPQVMDPEELIYRLPRGGQGTRYYHFANLFESMRTGKKVFQDGTFGLRAAAPALATNLSQTQNKIINWDPEAMKLL